MLGVGCTYCMEILNHHHLPPLRIYATELKLHTKTITIIGSILSTMTSSNGNIFRVTGPLCGEFTGPGEFPTQRPVTRSFDVFFDLRLHDRLSKQPWGWWFETPSWSLWRQCNGMGPAHTEKTSLSHVIINILPILSATYTWMFSVSRIPYMIYRSFL